MCVEYASWSSRNASSLLKTLKPKHWEASFFVIDWSSFQKTNQLHSYGRNASNVHASKIGLLKDKIMKKFLDGIQETHFRSIPGTSDNDTLWCNWDNLKIWLKWPFNFYSAETKKLRCFGLRAFASVGKMHFSWTDFVHTSHATTLLLLLTMFSMFSCWVNVWATELRSHIVWKVERQLAS